MKTVTKEYVSSLMENLKNDDYSTICTASNLVMDIACGRKTIDVDERYKSMLITSLYRKLMRATMRKVHNNPNLANTLAKDMGVSTMAYGEYCGIEEG